MCVSVISGKPKEHAECSAPGPGARTMMKQDPQTKPLWQPGSIRHLDNVPGADALLPDPAFGIALHPLDDRELGHRAVSGVFDRETIFGEIGLAATIPGHHAQCPGTFLRGQGKAQEFREGVDKLGL